MSIVRLEPAPETEVASVVTTTPLLPGGTERITVRVEDIPYETDLRFEARVDGSTVVGGAIVECNDEDNSDGGEERCPGLE